MWQKINCCRLSLHLFPVRKILVPTAPCQKWMAIVIGDWCVSGKTAIWKEECGELDFGWARRSWRRWIWPNSRWFAGVLTKISKISFSPGIMGCFFPGCFFCRTGGFELVQVSKNGMSSAAAFVVAAIMATCFPPDCLAWSSAKLALLASSLRLHNLIRAQLKMILRKFRFHGLCWLWRWEIFEKGNKPFLTYRWYVLVDVDRLIDWLLLTKLHPCFIKLFFFWLFLVIGYFSCDFMKFFDVGLLDWLILNYIGCLDMCCSLIPVQWRSM